MKKFKVGDRVKRVNSNHNGGYCKVGDILTVVAPGYGSTRVRMGEGEFFCFDDTLELYTPLTKEDLYGKCVYVKDEKESRAAQEKLFSLGFRWNQGQVRYVNFRPGVYMGVSDSEPHTIQYASDGSTHTWNDNIIKLNELLEVEEMKKAKGEVKVEYKVKREFDVRDLIDLGPGEFCTDAIADVVKYGVLDTYCAKGETLSAGLIDKADRSYGGDNGLRWLIEHGYVEKVEKVEEVFYSVGDRFKHQGTEYVLAQVNSGVCAMISIEGMDVGNRKAETLMVNDVRRITTSEFKKMAGYGFGEFVKI